MRGWRWAVEVGLPWVMLMVLFAGTLWAVGRQL